MGKREKREERKRQRLNKAFDDAFKSITKACPNCKKLCTITALSNSVFCVCGHFVRRKDA